ncbi:MAG: diguanylate cyclase [Betaproteobacteria bacterium]|nr:diguanylate cyclase [Betaproteobacteria bacterium]
MSSSPDTPARDPAPSRMSPDLALCLLQAAFEQNPQMAVVLDGKGKVLHANQAVQSLVGPLGDTPYWQTPIWQPDHAEELREAVLAAAEGQLGAFEATHVRPEGGVLYMAYTATPLRVGDAHLVMLLGHDVTRRTREESDMRQREQALEMVASASLELLREPDLDATLNSVLSELGRETGADRVYIYENRRAMRDQPLTASLAYEWVRPGVDALLGREELQRLDLGKRLPRWEYNLAAGLSVRGRISAFPLEERQLLEPLGIRSMLLAPIRLSDEFWGFLGFDAVHQAREWSAAEENVLRLVAASLGAAIVRRRAVEELRLSAVVFENTRDGIFIADTHSGLLAVNPAFEEITGYVEAEVQGRPYHFLHTSRPEQDTQEVIDRTVREQGHWQGEVWSRRKDGGLFPQRLSLSTVRNEWGETTQLVGLISDISQIKEAEAHLQHLAHYDALTDLPNRLLAQSRLEHALEKAQRHKGHVAVLFIDLDRFKQVNDTYGHQAGDELLVAVAKRLGSRLREEDTLARLGGDEFLFLLESVRSPKDAAKVSSALIQLLLKPFSLKTAGGASVSIGASIGISLFPTDGTDSISLTKAADAAMYQAKQAGRNTFRFSDAALNAEYAPAILPSP